MFLAIDLLMDLEDLKHELGGVEFVRAAALQRDVREGVRIPAWPRWCRS